MISIMMLLRRPIPRKDGIPYHGDKSRIRPGMWKFKNLTGDDNVIDENDKTVIGNAQPKFYGGLNNSFTYKGFDLSIFPDFQLWQRSAECDQTGYQ